jgi:hypothetical protein
MTIARAMVPLSVRWVAAPRRRGTAAYRLPGIPLGQLGLGEDLDRRHRPRQRAHHRKRERPTAAWRGFFTSFPDYRNVFTSFTVRGDVVTIVGHSVCAEPSLAGPALWTATTRDGQVGEWRVYPDTPEVRAKLGAAEGALSARARRRSRRTPSPVQAPASITARSRTA